MCACGNASLCDLAAVMEASKEDDAVLVHQHAVPAAGRGPALAGQLLPGPVFQIQPPQVLVVLELLLYWHLIFLQPVRHMSGYQRPNGLSSTLQPLHAIFSMARDFTCSLAGMQTLL